jgi:hypothetical protein
VAHQVPVAQQTRERGEHEQRREDVQHAHPGLQVAHTVTDQQDAGDRAEQCRAGQPPRDPDDQQDHDRAGGRGREAPADAVVAEQPFADRDEVLAHRRVHGQFVAGVVLEAAVAQHLPRLRHVVLLVEDRGAVVGRETQVLEANHGADQRDDERDQPAAQPVGRHRPAEPIGRLVELGVRRRLGRRKLTGRDQLVLIGRRCRLGLRHAHATSSPALVGHVRERAVHIGSLASSLTGPIVG